MSRGLPKQVNVFVTKSRDAALTAVANYNNPFLTFRTATYITHMQIAWTALLLAISVRNKQVPYQREKDSKRFIRVQGRRRCWGLDECIDYYFPKDEASAVRDNLRFLKTLRDMIEHDEMPALDAHVAGECQASLFNFEDLLIAEFGQRYALKASLANAMQFSRSFAEEQLAALRTGHKGLSSDVKDYIERFRSGLSSDVFSSQQFSFKVFLVPNIVANNRKDTLAVEWVDYGKLTDAEKAAYDKIPALIKMKSVAGYPFPPLKPGQIVADVKARLPDAGFSLFFNHFLSVHLQVRPEDGAADPKATDLKYCAYDEVGKRYVFSKAWVDRIVSELDNDDKIANLYANACAYQQAKNKKATFVFDQHASRRPPR